MKLQTPLAAYRRLTDEELVYRFADRSEPEAVHVLFERYGHLVLGVCNKMLYNPEQALTVSRSIFLNLLEQVKAEKISNFKSWLMEETVAVCRHHMAITSTVTNTSSFCNKPEAASESLQVREKDLVEDFFSNKKTFAEIAHENGLTIKQVRDHLRKGKRKLLSVLKEGE